MNVGVTGHRGIWTRLRRFQHATGLFPIDEKLVIVSIIFVAGGDQIYWDWRDATSVYAGAVVYGFLISYNKYRGRVADGLNAFDTRALPADDNAGQFIDVRRPVSGDSRRHRWIEVGLVAAFVVGAGLPAAVGRGPQAALAAAAMVAYIALFENRYATRPSPYAKIGSVAVSTGLATGGLLTSTGAGAAHLAGTLAVVVCWRTGWDLVLDVMDIRADQAAGIPTVATRHGLVTTFGVVSLLLVALSGWLVTWAATTSTATSARASVVPIAVVAVVQTVLCRRWKDGRSIDVSLRALRFTLGAGLATMAFAGNHSVVGAVLWLLTAAESAYVIHRRQPYFWTRLKAVTARTAAG